MADNPIQVDALQLNVKTSVGSGADDVERLVRALADLKTKYSALQTGTKGYSGLFSGFSREIADFGSSVSKNITRSKINSINDLASAFNALKQATSGLKIPDLSAAGKKSSGRMPTGNGGNDKQKFSPKSSIIPEFKSFTKKTFNPNEQYGPSKAEWQKVNAEREATLARNRMLTEARNAEAEEELKREREWNKKREEELAKVAEAERQIAEQKQAEAARKNQELIEKRTQWEFEQKYRQMEKDAYERYIANFVKERQRLIDEGKFGGRAEGYFDAEGKFFSYGANLPAVVDNSSGAPETTSKTTDYFREAREMFEESTQAAKTFGNTVKKSVSDIITPVKALRMELQGVYNSIQQAADNGDVGAVGRRYMQALSIEKKINRAEGAEKLKKDLGSIYAAASATDEKILEIGARIANINLENAWKFGDVGEIKAAIEGVNKAKGDISSYYTEKEAGNTLMSDLGSAGASQAMLDYAKSELEAGRSSSSLRKELLSLDGELKQKPKDTKKAESGLSKLGNAMKVLRSHTHKTHHSHNNLLKQFGRVAKMRAMRAAIRAITAGLKEGIGNLYEYSKAMKTSFSGKMDAASSALLTMKNSIATAIAPLIEMLLPTLQKVVGWIREAANWLAQVFAQLNGQSTWTRAKDAVVEYAEATKEAKDNTKEMLASFDELNVIASESNGSGSGKKAVDYKSMFEEVSTFDQSSTQWANRLKKIFEVIKGIWEKIKPVVKKVFSTISDWISKNWGTIEKVFTWVGDHFAEILTTVVAIKGSLSLWKLAKNFIPGLNDAKSALGGISNLCNILSGIGLITIGISIVRTITDMPETQEAMKAGKELSEQTKQHKKGTSTLESIGGGLATLFGKSPLTRLLGTEIMTSGLIEKIIGIDPNDMLANLAKRFADDPDSFLDGRNSGKKNPVNQYVNAHKGSVWTNSILASWGLPVNEWFSPSDGKKHYTTIDVLDDFYKQMDAALKRNNKLLKDAGVDAKDILDNWDLIAPLVNSEGMEESTKRILGLINTYGKDWIKHLDKIGLDTRAVLIAQSREFTKYGKLLPDSLAKGIADSKEYRTSLRSILTAANLTITEAKKIFNNSNLTMPMVQRYGYEESLRIIEQVARYAGKDTEEILWSWDLVAPSIDSLGYETSIKAIKTLANTTGTSIQYIMDNWHLIAPHIDPNNFAQSMHDITALIDKYGFTEWQKHLDELHLTANVGINTDKVTQGIAQLIQKVKDGVRNVWDNVMGSLFGGGASSGSGSNSSNNSSNNSSSSGSKSSSGSTSNLSSDVLIEPDTSVTGTQAYAGYTATQPKASEKVTHNVLGDMMLTQSWAKGVNGTIKTVTDALASLSSKQASTFTQAFQIKTEVGKENSKKLEVFNLTKAEVAWLRANGYRIPTDYEHYNYGKGIRQIRQLAKGGIGIPSGELFLANEGGVPEMIGRIGNQNAVVNNTQIIQGIAQGVASVMAGVERRLERIERYAGITAEKEFAVKLAPSVGLARVNAQAAAMYSAVTGR